MKFSHMLSASVAAVCLMNGISLAAAPFNPGDVLVYRDATNNALIPLGATVATTTLSANGNEVIVDEFTPTGTLVGSFDTGMVDAGSSSSHGLMTLSANGQYLAVPGYSSFVSTGLNNSNGSTDARVVQVYSSTGTAVGTVNFTDADITSDYRSAATDGTNVWMTGGGTTGIRTNTITSPTATTSNILTTTSGNFRGLSIYGSQLYLSTNDSGRLNSVGSGTPTTGGQTLTSFPGLPTSGFSTYQYVLLDLTGNDGIFDTLYMADDTSATTGIRKFSLVSGSWVQNGLFRSSPATAVRGLTGELNADGSVSLFATFANTSSGQTSSLYGYTDLTGYSGSTTGLTGTLTTLSTINTSADVDPSVLTGTYRGVVVLPGGTPVPEPATLGVLVMGGAALILRRRK